MEQPGQLFQALLYAATSVVTFLLQRYEPFKGWGLFRFLSWAAGWSTAVHLSKAFDLPPQMSLRSHIVNWSGFVILLLLLIWRERTAKKAKPGAV